VIGRARTAQYAAREMKRRLRAEEAKPRYTDYPGRDHKIWDSVYRSPELYQWLRRQQRN
jgi:hypothetical protein